MLKPRRMRVMLILAMTLGIAPEHVHKVFDRFYSADRQVRGTGLGLLIARWAVEAHGGRIELTRP